MSILNRLALPLLALSLLSPAVRAESNAKSMSDAAKALLTALTPDQRAKSTFPFDGEERLNWHFIPRERKGLSWKEMTPEQRLLAQGLLSSGLSQDGYRKATSIMSLEEVLFNMEGAGAREKRDPEKYYVSIFGEPSPTATWGWRVEGHHLSLNFTVKDGKMLNATPSFYGTNPGEVREGPRAGLRVLADEEDFGLALAKALTEEQWKKALVSATAFPDMITLAQRDVSPLTPEGLSDTELTAEQKPMLAAVVKEFLNRVSPEIAEANWKEIEASGPLHFAWAGAREKGAPTYYRVQGKTFLLEYDNTQNNANHVHTVWRDFDSDFGRDFLKEHAQAEKK